MWLGPAPGLSQAAIKRIWGAFFESIDQLTPDLVPGAVADLLALRSGTVPSEAGISSSADRTRARGALRFIAGIVAFPPRHVREAVQRGLDGTSAIRHRLDRRSVALRSARSAAVLSGHRSSKQYPNPEPFRPSVPAVPVQVSAG